MESLPSSGLPVTNADQSEINAYYNLQDGGVYGYIDATLSSGFGVPQGWYPVSTLLGGAGLTYSGVISNVDDDPKDSTYRVLLKYTLYAHNGTDWVEYVTKTQLDEAIANKKLYTHIISYQAEKLQSGIAYIVQFSLCVYRDSDERFDALPSKWQSGPFDTLANIKGQVLELDEANDLLKTYIITDVRTVITDELNFSYYGTFNGMTYYKSVSINPETIEINNYYVGEV